jgi:hypothetical protein
VDKILSAVVTPGGAVLVSDEDREAILRFDAAGQYLGTFPGKDAARRKVTRIVVDGEGGIVTLDREEKAVRVWDETGRLLRTVGPAGLRRPADVAVDASALYGRTRSSGSSSSTPRASPSRRSPAPS